MATNEKVSIFQTLKYAGEHFFENKEILADVRERSDTICKDYRKQFNEIQPQSQNPKQNKIQGVDVEILFRPLNIKKPKEMEYEKREEIRPKEENLIKEACQKKGISLSEVENIKHSLGYKTETSTYKKPCVAVVGQTKAGKSSLINSILQARVVPQKAMRQTARVTYVTHCTTKFVAHMQNSRLLKIELETDVRNEDVDLQFRDRNKKGEISVEIRVGTTNPIVQNGFDIVDSPGLNENPALNDLCEKMEKSLLPLLIYVVEGRNGLTQTDVDDIKQIRHRTPQLKIIYFVTKLARSKYDRLMYMERKKKMNMKENEDIPGESDVEVAKRRMGNVLKKMKREAIISLSTEFEETESNKSRDFHGADIWAVNEMRIHSPDAMPSECDKFNFNQMKWFEESLMMYLKDRLESPLKEEIQYIQSPMEDVLEKATSVASDIATERLEKQKSLELFKKYEEDLYEEELKHSETTLKDALNKLIEDSKLRLYDMIKEMLESNPEFQRMEGNQVRQPLASFVDEIKNRIELSFDETIKTFVTKFMVEKEERLRSKLCRVLKHLKVGYYGSQSFEIMLRNRLLYEYDFFDDFSRRRAADFTSEQNCSISYNSRSVMRIVQLIREKGSLTIGLFKKTKTSSEWEHDQKETKEMSSGKEWIPKLVQKVLNDFDHDRFMKTICNIATEDFRGRHNRFVQQLEDQGKFLKGNLNIGQEQKKCVRSFAEELGVQFARAVHVRTPIEVMIDPLRPAEKVQKGGQANVDKAFIIGQTKPIVIKSYRQTFKNFSTSERLKRIAMEIYYSCRLTHPRCLELLGMHFHDTPEGWRFSAYYPYLEMGTMKQYLYNLGVPRNKTELQTYLKERLELCIEVAEGITFLHKLQIVHRDINLRNILVREVENTQPEQYGKKISKVQAVISDYGLTKSFGFIEHTDKVGTPLYMAPELFNKTGLLKDGYSPAVDVFSFGMCAWQLISYNLHKDYMNYYPQFAIDCEHDQETVEKLVIDGYRPEKRTLIPSELNELLKRCWDSDPDKRPSFTKQMGELAIDIEPNDPMFDKTILNVLHDAYRKSV